MGFWNSFWESKMRKFIRGVAKEGMTCFDIGAHLGEYTKLFSVLVGGKGKVFAFEPTKNSFEKLTLKLKELEYVNVILVNKAVYSRNCKIMLQEFPKEQSSWNTLGHPRMYDSNGEYPIEKSTEVEAITLDSFCQKHNINEIDYLKIDVEGAEFDVLKGASDLLESKSIHYIQFEVSRTMLEGMNTTIEPVFDFLKSKDYVCHFVNANGTIGTESFNSHAKIENYIALRS